MKKEFESRLTKIEAALDKAVKMDFDSEWKDKSFGDLPQAITKQHIQCLIEPNKNLIDLGGKRWRPLFLILCYEMVSKNNSSAVSADDVYTLTPLVEFVHTASLIHDDIEDSADLRRGKPAAHITYGLDTALNAAAWFYFQAPVCLQNPAISEEMKLKFFNLYTKELRCLHLGQAMDIYWHRNTAVFPTIDEYKSMVQNKTGTLANLASQVGIIAGGESESKADEIGKIAAQIGVGFQIIDDVINLTKGNVGKKRGDDIVEGKKSLPVLLHIQKKPQDKEELSVLMQIASKEGIDSPAVEKCITLLNTSECISDAAKQGRLLIEESCGKLMKLAKEYGTEEIGQLITDLFISMIPQLDGEKC